MTNSSKTYLAWKLNTMLDTRIGFQRLPLDLIQQIGTTTKELVMRKFPSLCVG